MQIKEILTFSSLIKLIFISNLKTKIIETFLLLLKKKF